MDKTAALTQINNCTGISMGVSINGVDNLASDRGETNMMIASGRGSTTTTPHLDKKTVPTANSNQSHAYILIGPYGGFRHAPLQYNIIKEYLLNISNNEMNDICDN